jgi:hypothetical protein
MLLSQSSGGLMIGTITFVLLGSASCIVEPRDAKVPAVEISLTNLKSSGSSFSNFGSRLKGAIAGTVKLTMKDLAWRSMETRLF